MSTTASPEANAGAARATRVALVIGLMGLAGCPATVGVHEGVRIEDRPRADLPPADTAALTVHYGAIACHGGSLFPASVMVGAHAVAEVAPASEAVVQVPPGAVRIVAGALVTEVDVGPAGARIVLGCDQASFLGAPLQPLTLIAPAVGCQALPPLRVKAGGLERKLVHGERWTILLPRGGHVVRFGVTGNGDRTVSLTIDDGGKELALAPGCVLLEPSPAATSTLAPGL